MEFSFVRALGTRVIEVEALGCDAHYLPGLNILLIDSGLTSAQRRYVNARLEARVSV